MSPAANADAMTAQLAMDVRLLNLETRIHGSRSYLEVDAHGSRGGHGGKEAAAKSSKTAMRRVHDIGKGIESIGDGSDAMKRFLANYSSYKSLLTIPGTEDLSTNEVFDPLVRPTDASDGKPGRLSEADLIPGSVKSTMIMEAAQDIRALERDLRLVESYRDRDAAGAGDLEELVKLSGALKGLEMARQAEKARSDATRRAVGDTLMRYNNHNATVSDLFLDIHHRLEALEDQVARAERKKRKELESRY